MPVRRLILPVLLACLFAQPSAHAEAGTCVQLTDPPPKLDFSPDPRLILDADRADLLSGGLSSLTGSVRLRYGDKEFTADQLDFDKEAGTVAVNAESNFRNEELLIRSESASFDLNNETGLFNDTSFVLIERAARGTSQRVELARDATVELEGVRYTSCAPGTDTWYLEASEIKLDTDEGLGTAKHARLRFMGVPILYAPWFQFPIDDRRRSGLLFPVIGETDKTGWDFRVPLYLNLAPNYDATITPRYMSDRGVQIDTEAQYLLRRAEGSLGYEYLSEDRATGERRDFTEFSHRGVLSSRLGMDIHYAEVSDPAYFEDLGGTVDLSSITHLERSARFIYNAPAAYTVQALFQDYQTIASNLDPIDDPYRRVPQIRIDAITRNGLWNTRVGADAEYVNFVRSSSVEGQRIDLHPYLRWERDRVAWFAKSQIDYRYTAYELTDTAAGVDSTQDRALPQFSAEAGLRFERIDESGALQTLEPRLYYLFVPTENQDSLPVFDSGEPDFDFTQLFARNRFSGEDRISDANQFAVALTGRQLDANTGNVRASASFGQLFRFEAPEVRLPDEVAPPRGATDFIGSVNVQLSDRWTALIDTQWSPKSSNFTRTAAGMRYRSERRWAELAYRFREDLLEQTDLIVSTPVYGGVSLVGRWRYSIADDHTLDSMAGLSYETCCWAVHTSYRRYVADTRGDFNSGVYLQLELKGLARIGSGMTDLFPNSMVE
ncbi:MAG TPA: LPS assembly protein LptD [Fontimonas sp.]